MIYYAVRTMSDLLSYFIESSHIRAVFNYFFLFISVRRFERLINQKPKKSGWTSRDTKNVLCFFVHGFSFVRVVKRERHLMVFSFSRGGDVTRDVKSDVYWNRSLLFQTADNIILRAVYVISKLVVVCHDSIEHSSAIQLNHKAAKNVSKVNRRI